MLCLSSFHEPWTRTTTSVSNRRRSPVFFCADASQIAQLLADSTGTSVARVWESKIELRASV